MRNGFCEEQKVKVLFSATIAQRGKYPKIEQKGMTLVILFPGRKRGKKKRKRIAKIVFKSHAFLLDRVNHIYQSDKLIMII